MKASLIKTTLRLSLLFPLLLATLLLGEAEAQAIIKKKKKLSCRRGTLKIRLVDGKRKAVCVVKRVKQPSEPKEESTAGPLTWSASWWGRVAGRSENYPFIASNRYRAYLEGQRPLSQYTKAVFGARATYDLMASLQTEEDYRDDFSRNKAPDVELWDAYYEYRKNAWRIRLGQQQVAWGETFGFFYADIVNPKDLRERNLGRLYELRLPVPMANLQWSTRRFNAQILLLPFFKPHRMPNPQSDFFPDLQDDLRFKITSGYKRDDSPGDIGARLSGTVSNVDLSLIYFNHINREPYYKVKSFSPTGILLHPHHQRIQSFGFTFSADVDGHVLRGENVYTPSRKFNAEAGMSIDGQEFDQRVHVLGVDLPKFDKLMVGVQASLDTISGDNKPLFRKEKITLASVRLGHDLVDERQIESITSVDLNDSSTLIQFRYLHPFSPSHEVEGGVDYFSGKEESFFGQARKASRIYIGIRGAFNG